MQENKLWMLLLFFSAVVFIFVPVKVEGFSTTDRLNLAAEILHYLKYDENPSYQGYVNVIDTSVSYKAATSTLRSFNTYEIARKSILEFNGDANNILRVF